MNSRKGKSYSFYINPLIYDEFVKTLRQQGIDAASPIVEYLMDWYTTKYYEEPNEQPNETV